MRRPGPQNAALRLVTAGAFAFVLALGASAGAKTHTVYEGQRLGSIAKRYNVTVEELCAANGLDPRKPIKPGMKLTIPEKGKSAGDKTAAADEKPEKGKSAGDKESAKTSSKAKDGDKPEAVKPGKPTTHVVAKGHTLSAISGRYGVTVGAICTANDLPRTTSLTVGQRLVIPAKTDKDGSYARKLRRSGALESEVESGKGDDAGAAEPAKGADGRPTWAKYVKPPWKKGYLKLRRYGREWHGYVIGPKGEVLSVASKKINYVLGARQGGPEIDEKLIRVVAAVSDKFGGRELRIVSGFRTKSFVEASKHKQGRALDFSIPGVPNEALRDFLRTLPDVGVGYYPNSSFVHLDVRGYNAFWVDYAGPGEAPRKSPKGKKASEAAGGADGGSGDDSHDSGETYDTGEFDTDEPSEGGSLPSVDDAPEEAGPSKAEEAPAPAAD